MGDSLFKKFREKYKAIVNPVKQPKESEEAEARRLTGMLDAVIVNAIMFEPFNGDYSKVQLNEQCVGYIEEILNTSNKLILENEFYKNIKEKLKELLKQNSQGVKVEDLEKIGKDTKKLFYDMQPQEFWERKVF